MEGRYSDTDRDLYGPWYKRLVSWLKRVLGLGKRRPNNG